MKKLYSVYFVIVVSSILLIINIYELDFDHLDMGSYAGIIGNVLLIAAMIVTIRDIRNTDVN